MTIVGSTSIRRVAAADAGMAYVMILLVLVISVSLALSFLLRVGTETEATMSRSAGMQVEYLAESAAAHAKWLLLNDPTFPADESTYYMHSFVGGRYGYKVRRHTATTFATISTVGVLGDDVVQQSYVLYILPNLAGRWKLDESSGITAEDSGGGDDGTLKNMGGNSWSTGIDNGALCFDGNNDYVDIGGIGGTVKTIAFWMKANTLGTYATDSGFRSPTNWGDDYTQWRRPERAVASDNSKAEEDTNDEKEDWYDFDFGLPASATILGIEVTIEAKDRDGVGTGVDVELSWNGGTSYTATGYGYTTTSKTMTVRTFGGAADEWGRTWSDSELSNASFRIRLDKKGTDTKKHQLDHIQVKVYYSVTGPANKVIGFNATDYIEIDGVTSADEPTPIPVGFPGTTTIYVDGSIGAGLSTDWHHVVITDTTGISATNLLLGKPSADSADYFDGCLDDVRVYDHVLTQTEIDELRLSAGLVGHWMFDDGGGNTASDSSGNALDGTLTNMDPGTDWVGGHIDGALDFDGANDIVIVPDDNALDITGGITLAAWANSNALNGTGVIVAKGDAGTIYNYLLGTDGDKVTFQLNDGGWFLPKGGPKLLTGVWYHLAATFDSANDICRLFVDGVEVHSATTTKNMIANAEDVTIGSDPWDEDWNGMVDDVRVYNRVLSDDEIAALAGM